MSKCGNKNSCANSSCKNTQDKKIILHDEYDTPVPIEDKEGNRLKTYIAIAGGFIAVVLVVYMITKLLST